MSHELAAVQEPDPHLGLRQRSRVELLGPAVQVVVGEQTAGLVGAHGQSGGDQFGTHCPPVRVRVLSSHDGQADGRDEGHDRGNVTLPWGGVGQDVTQQRGGSDPDGIGVELDGVVGAELDVGDQAHAQDVELPLGAGSQDGAPVPGITQAHALDEGGGARVPASELQLAAHRTGDEAYGSR